MLNKDYAKGRLIPGTTEMRILLVMQPTDERWGILMPSIGVCYISSYLKSKGHDVCTLSLFATKDDVVERLKAKITVCKPDIVAVGGYFNEWEKLKIITDTAKGINPDIITLIGGGLVTYSPNEAMQLIPSADIGVIGEGEKTTHELLVALQSVNSDLTAIQSLIIRDEERLVITSKRADIKDLDSIPFPDYEGFELLPIFTGMKEASIVSSRSCPYNCTFCVRSGGSTYRMRSLDDVFAEIDYLVENCGIRKLTLRDELFSLNPDRLLEFCARIKPYGIQWRLSLRCSDKLNAEIFAAMKGSGCLYLQFGMESCDDRVLKSMNKKITLAQIERCNRLAHEAGIKLNCQVIFGDIVETLNMAKETIDWVKGHLAWFMTIKLDPIVLYPGSILYDKAVANGKIANTVEFIRKGCPLTNVSAMSDDEYAYLVNTYLSEARKEIDLVINGAQNIDAETEGRIVRADEGKLVYERKYMVKMGEGIVNTLKYDQYYAESSDYFCSWQADFSLESFFAFTSMVFKELFSKGDIAIYGTGRFFMIIMDQLKTIERAFAKSSKFILCDSQSSGSVLMDRDVLPPDNALSQCPVVLVPNRYVHSIKEEIQLKFPDIEVVPFFELPIMAINMMRKSIDESNN